MSAKREAVVVDRKEKASVLVLILAANRHKLTPDPSHLLYPKTKVKDLSKCYTW